MQEGQAPAPEGQAAPAQKGGGMAEALVATDKTLSMLAQTPSLPPELKEQATMLRDGFSQLLEAVMAHAKGGAQQPPGAPEQAPPQQPRGNQPVAPEAGVSGAVPVTPGGVRR